MSRDFNGTTSIINCGSGQNAILTDMQPMTVMAWISPDNSGENSSGRICGKIDSGANGGAWTMFTTANSGLAFIKVCATTNVRVETAYGTIKFGQWQHVAMTWEGGLSASTVHMYHNFTETLYSGQTDGSAAILSDAAEGFYIGNDGGVTRTFNGRIAHLQVYRRILTVNEMRESAGSPGIRSLGPLTAANTGGLAGYWDCEGMSLRENDKSGNGASGTVTNLPVAITTDVPPVNQQYGPQQPAGAGYYSGG